VTRVIRPEDMPTLSLEQYLGILKTVEAYAEQAG
jgi:hypothetical protein